MKNLNFNSNSLNRSIFSKYKRGPNIIKSHKTNHLTKRNVFHNLRHKRFTEPLYDIKEGIFMDKLKKGSYNWVFGHLAFALSAASYFSDDLLNLRIAAVFASANAILFNRYWIKPPLVLAINYHFFFIMINSYHIGRYFYLEHFHSFTQEEMDLYNETYSKTLTIQQYHSLLKCSEFRDYSNDELIIKQDQKLRYIYHIVKGKCTFHRKNKDGELEFFFYMKKNFMVGELAYIQQEGTKVHQIGTVKAREPTRVLAIDLHKLKKLIKTQEPTLGPAYLSLLTHDLIDRFTH